MDAAPFMTAYRFRIFREANERASLEIIKRFEVERIAFDLPSRTLYL
jgi:hypothetical protein